jgi:hypothetical protein
MARTKARDKVLSLWRNITGKDEFQEWVKKTRVRYGIPAGGFEDDSENPNLPKDWKHLLNLKKRTALSNAASRFAKKMGFPHSEGGSLAIGYLFYGQSYEVHESPHEFNLCVVTDVLEEKNYPYTRIISESDEKFYPVSIRVSPEASLRDILDFVKKNYLGSIEYIQEKYKDESLTIGKTRKRNPALRSMYGAIYHLREKEKLSATQIGKLIQEQYGKHLDKGVIEKIISLERKRRK